jgi:hypothetical protein
MIKNTYATRSTLVKQHSALDTKKKIPQKKKPPAPARMTENGAGPAGAG